MRRRLDVGDIEVFVDDRALRVEDHPGHDDGTHVRGQQQKVCDELPSGIEPTPCTTVVQVWTGHHHGHHEGQFSGAEDGCRPTRHGGSCR